VTGETLPRLYRDLAAWWPLLSDPADYAEEAGFYAAALTEAADGPVRTVLELGCGGGNNASHMKKHFQLTLTDISPDMLAVSRNLNPDTEHIVGDMRSLRLGREFDAVFVHDAIIYLTTEGDLRKALATAYVHCRPGGAALVAPDYTRETFQPRSGHGGHDSGQRGMRYLEWDWAAGPDAERYVSDMVYLLREADGTVRVEHDRTVLGLFARDTWLGLMAEVGFRAAAVPFDHDDVDPRSAEVFIGTRPSTKPGAMPLSSSVRASFGKRGR